METLRRLRWQILIVVVALIAIAVLLSGQQPVQVQVFEPEPVAGGVYTEGLIGSLNRLNPVLDTYNPADKDINRLLFSSLVRFDDRGLPRAELAESWGISRDATVYNFSLRKGAKWHDGESVTSSDVVFTIDLIRSPDLPTPEDIRTMWMDIEVIILDDFTLQFRLPEPFAPFLDYLTFGILPSHHFEGLSPGDMIEDPFNLAPIGSGPYQFQNFIVEGGDIIGVSLTAFDEYFLDRPFIDDLVFIYFEDDSQALEAYQAGEIMGISKITDSSLSDALVEQDLNIYTGRLPELSMVILNLDNPRVPFFQNVNIRKAMLMGIHRQWIIDYLLNGQAMIADGPIFPNTWAYYDGIGRIEYDSIKATNIIREAGYTIPADNGGIRADDTGPFAFTLLHPEGETHTAVAKRIQEYWSDLGIGVTLRAVPYESLISVYLDTRNFEAALVDINLTRSPDPDPYPFWHQTQATTGQNYSMWNDRQASEYLEQARIIVDPSERTRLYRNFQVRFIQELPVLPLYYPVYSFGVDEEVEGVRTGPLVEPNDRFANITEWFLFSERVLEQEQISE
jgi:peptide/nickel transport system substrate-binding protein